MIVLLVAALAAAEPVGGRVFERGSGDPIEGVEIRVAGEITTTDHRGRFTVDVPPGSHALDVVDPEHLPATVTVDVPTRRRVRVFLEPLPGPLEIVVQSFRPITHTTVHSIDAEQAHETPGTHEDAVRLVQSLPGVSIQREYSPTTGDLSVRGSSPGDNRYYLDGVEVPYLYHFNQYASVFPTSQLAHLELMSSTFGASYGDAVGAIVEASSKGDAPEAVHGSVTLNAITLGADLRVPLGRTWWASASGRRSFHDLAGERSDQFTVWPVFYDFSTRLQRGDADRHIAMFAWGAGDAYTRAAGELDLLDPVDAAESPLFRYRRDFQVVGLQHRWSGRTRGRLVGAFVNDVLAGALDGVGEQKLTTRYLTSRLDAEGGRAWQPWLDELGWAAGWELRSELTDLRVEGAGPLGLLVAREAPALARGADVDATIGRARASGYAELQLERDGLRIVPGLRMDVDTRVDGARPQLAPRLSASWQTGRETAFKAAFGRYLQAPDTEHLLPDTGDPELPITESWQIAVGMEQTFARRIELGIDGYRKWHRDPLVYPVDGPARVAARGDAIGLELTTRYRLRDRLFVRAWFGVAHTTDTVDGLEAPTDYDQRVSGGVVASWDPTPRWNVGIRYRIGTGLPYTPVDDSVYDATLDQWSPVPGERNSVRLPLYQKLDIQLAYTFIFRRWRLTLRAELWYVPQSSNQLYPAWNYDFTEQTWVRGISVLPLLGARATF